MLLTRRFPSTLKGFWKRFLRTPYLYRLYERPKVFGAGHSASRTMQCATLAMLIDWALVMSPCEHNACPCDCIIRSKARDRRRLIEVPLRTQHRRPCIPRLTVQRKTCITEQCLSSLSGVRTAWFRLRLLSNFILAIYLPPIDAVHGYK